MTRPLPLETEISYEPTPSELSEFDARSYDSEILNLDEIRMLEKHLSERRDYIQELAEEAWYYFVTQYGNRKKDKNLFIESVVGPIPWISDRIKDKGEILRSMVHDVASRLSKMIWENRKRKEARKKLHPPKRTPYKVQKERRAAEQAKALDVLEHGTYHGEFYLPGITAKSMPVRQRRKSCVKRHLKREKIPSDEQLGGIIAEQETEEHRRNWPNLAENR